ncbi:MEDS domain-containing protein [Streptomyces radiopugnans]|uniref:MEDS domain-containing protein n=1 Tax=Streptomyces radiopugnans TaxID=403935 RepID=UPI003F1B49B8
MPSAVEAGPGSSPGGGGHLCCAYAGEDEGERGAAVFVRNGPAGGQQVVYFSDTAAPEAVVERLGRAGIDAQAALDRRRLVVRRAEDSYLRWLPFAPGRMVAAWEQACAAALEAGCTGLHAVGETAWCARETPGADRVLEYELRLNAEVFTRLPLTALCLYDREAVPEDTTALLTAARTRRLDFRGRVAPATDTDAGLPLGATPSEDRVGFRLRGDADLDTRAVLEKVLAALARLPGPVVHLDLSGAGFLDAAAVAELVAAAAAERGRGRRLVPHRPPYSLRRVAGMFPDECGTLEMTL